MGDLLISSEVLLARGLGEKTRKSPKFLELNFLNISLIQQMKVGHVKFYNETQLHYNISVPQVLRTCSLFLEDHGIIDGIYRVSGITSNIQRIK